MKKLIVADIKSNNVNGICAGHYLAVARNYLQMFVNICDVKIAGGPIYKSSFNSSNLVSLPYDSDIEKNVIQNKIRVLFNARALFNIAKSSTILLQQSTATTSFVCMWLFAKSYSNIYMIQYDLSGIRGKLNKFLYKMAKKHIKGLLCPNSDVGKGYGLPYLVVPDYIYIPSNDIVSYIQFSKKKYDFCVLGRLNEDKGVIQTIQKLANTKYKTLIAGTPQGDNGFIDQLKERSRHAPNIDMYLGYISDKKYKEYINESRYAILNYHGDYSLRSSGVVLDFLFNNVPVIAHRCQAMQFVEDNEIGFLYDNLSSIDFDILLDESCYQKYQQNIEKYKLKFENEINSIANFLNLKEK